MKIILCPKNPHLHLWVLCQIGKAVDMLKIPRPLFSKLLVVPALRTMDMGCPESMVQPPFRRFWVMVPLVSCPA